MEIIRVIADSMSTNGKGIRDGAFGVGWVAAIIVEILLFIGGFDVNGSFELVVAREVYVYV